MPHYPSNSNRTALRSRGQEQEGSLVSRVLQKSTPIDGALPVQSFSKPFNAPIFKSIRRPTEPKRTKNPKALTPEIPEAPKLPYIECIIPFLRVPCFRYRRTVHARRADADHIGIYGVSWTLQPKTSRLSRFSGGSGGADVEAYRYLRCFPDLAAENVVPAVVFAEHPCANHDNVHIRPYPLPQSIHVPTMISSRSDHIHCRRASMCQP